MLAFRACTAALCGSLSIRGAVQDDRCLRWTRAAGRVFPVFLAGLISAGLRDDAQQQPRSGPFHAHEDTTMVPPPPSSPFIAQHPGNGYLLAMDSLAAPASGFVNTLKRVLSISQDKFTGPPGADFTHIMR